jgi:tetratricopeptide (TPR) repeat protein
MRSGNNTSIICCCAVIICPKSLILGLSNSYCHAAQGHKTALMNHRSIYMGLVSVVLLLGMIIPAKAASTGLDSLIRVVRSAPADSDRLKTLTIIAETAPDGVWEKYNSEILEICDRHLATDPNDVFYLRYKATGLNNSGFYYQQKGEPDSAALYYSQSLAISKKLNDNKNTADILNNLGSLYYSQGKVLQGIDHLLQAVEIQKKMNDSLSIAESYNNLGYIFNANGDVKLGLEYYTNSLKIRERVNDKKGIAISLLNIGSIYQNQNDLNKAIEFYTRAYTLAKSLNDGRSMGICLNNLGDVFKSQGDNEKALSYFLQSIRIQEEIGYKDGVALSTTNIGNLYLNKGEFDSALVNYQKGLASYISTQNMDGQANAYGLIGNVYSVTGKFTDALKNYLLSNELSIQLGSPRSIAVSSKNLYSIYKKTGDLKNALLMYETYIRMRDSINNDETRRSTYRQQINYEFEKKEAKVQADRQKTDALRDQETKLNQATQFWIRLSGLVIILSLVVVALVLYKRYRSKQRTTNELLWKNKVIEEKQKEILDSIHYAKRIQQSLLPPEKYIARSLERLNRKS